MELNPKFTNQQIQKIRCESYEYSFSCSSSVCEQIEYLRRLFNYQEECLRSGESELSMKTHQIIADITYKAHEIMEQCLEDVLNYEQWDLQTLDMPENIRKRLEVKFNDSLRSLSQ